MSDSSLKVGETSTLTITFDQAVTGFDNTYITVASGTLTDITSADGGITWTGTFTPTDDIEDTTNVIAVGTLYTDLLGNVPSTDNYTIDTKEPVVVSAVMSDSALLAGETSTLTITFSEAVTGFDNADISLANGTLTAVTSTNGGVTWTGTFTPTLGIIDTSNVILVGTTLTDLAGNAPVAGGSTANYTINTREVAASYQVIGGGGSGGYKGGGGGGGGYNVGTASGSTGLLWGSTYSILVGAGGAARASGGQGSNGGNSNIAGANAMTGYGGGGGGGDTAATKNGRSGGSGGGASIQAATGGIGGSVSIAGQGYAGGSFSGTALSPAFPRGSRGGGGAAGIPANANGSQAGSGGAGNNPASVGANYSGITYQRAGGGGGYSGTAGSIYQAPGGAGGGGKGGSAARNPPSGSNGSTNFGGGGGGGAPSGAGGSGIVIIIYPDTMPLASSTTGNPLISTSGGYRRYQFKSSGSITF